MKIMKTIKELIKDIDLEWVLNLCHQPEARLNDIIEKMTLKYPITGAEAKNIILLLALTDAAVRVFKDIKNE